MLWYVKVTWLTNLLAFIIGLLLYRKFPKEIKTIFFFVVFGLCTEIYSKIHLHFVMRNTMPIGHFYFPIAVLIAGLFYIQILKGFINSTWLIAVIALYEFYCIINPIFIQSLLQYASLTGSLGALLLFLFSVAYFAKVMVEAKIKKLSAEPLIWINSAFLIYYTVGFFFHSLYNLRTTASIEVTYFAGNLFSLLNLLFYSIILIGFILAGKSKQN